MKEFGGSGYIGPPLPANYHNGRNLCNQPILHPTHHRGKKAQM